MRLDTLHRAETPEGITLALRPAGVVARVLAYLIDFAIRLALFIAVGIATAWMGGTGAGLFMLVFFAIEWLYPVVFELSLHGATPGKRSLGLRVVMDSGLPVTPAAALTRNLLRAADLLPACYGIGLTSMLLRAEAASRTEMSNERWPMNSDPTGTPPSAPLTRRFRSEASRP